MRGLITSLFVVSFVIGSGDVVNAITLRDDFDGGISLANWDMGHFDATGAPWEVMAPDGNGRLRMSKSSDLDVNNLYVRATIDSTFIIDGDLSVSIDFNLVDFPLTGTAGWNEAVLELVGINSGNTFSCLRFTNPVEHLAEGFSSLPPKVLGRTADATLDGRLIVTRHGQEMSALMRL